MTSLVRGMAGFKGKTDNWSQRILTCLPLFSWRDEPFRPQTDSFWRLWYGWNKNSVVFFKLLVVCLCCRKIWRIWIWLGWTDSHRDDVWRCKHFWANREDSETTNMSVSQRSRIDLILLQLELATNGSQSERVLFWGETRNLFLQCALQDYKNNRLKEACLSFQKLSLFLPDLCRLFLVCRESEERVE